MSLLSPLRRLTCALVAVTAATALFHGQVAGALVTRGDDALRTGDVPTALREYGRALWLDRASSVAADRLAFYLALRHDPLDAAHAVSIASAVIRHRPEAANLFADRALAEVQLQRWSAAERDFARAGALASDARYDHFAARMALRAGDVRLARADERRALAVDPAFGPARLLARSLR